jgi:hypothetical protein
MRKSTPSLKLESLEPRLLLSYVIEPQEQLFVYLLNVARSDPQAYEIDAELPAGLLAGITAQPPLAVNELLSNSANFHAEEMADNDYFAHTSAVTNDQPNKMAIDAGYALPFGSNANNIESIAGGFGPKKVETAAGSLRLLIEDEGVNPPGHRIHLLATSSFWQDHREVGTGFANNNASTLRNYWAIHSAYVDTDDRFLTGVVYNDNNNNGLYDLNEGLSDVTVSTDQGHQVQTNSSGGWSLQVPAGTYIVEANGGGYNGTGSAVAIVSDTNVEVDFISGDASGLVDFGLDTGNTTPNVSVVATDANAAELGLDTATFTFTRTGDTVNAMTVNYTVAGTADSGDDYDDIGDSVEIPAGLTTATITLTPIDDGDIEGQETVIVTVIAGLEYQLGATPADTAFIADDEGAVVEFGDGLAKAVFFTDADGTEGSVSVKAATGNIVFMGSNVITTASSKGVVVTADGGASVDQITLENTGLKTSLAFKAKGGGDNRIDVKDIGILGPAKDIKGKQVNLTGNLFVIGGLTKLELADVADQHLFTFGPGTIPGSTLSIKLQNVVDLSITSTTPIKSLAVNNWEDAGDDDDIISAPWIGKISSKLDFAPGMTLTDNTAKTTLGGVKVTRAITGGVWTVDGHSGKITADSIAAGWSASFTGNLAGLATKQDASGDLTALTAKSVAIAGNYTNATLTLTQAPDPKIKALGKLAVKKKMDNVEVRSAGNVGNVDVGQLFNSNVFAGVNAGITDLPTSAADFDTAAIIASVKIKGIKTEAIWMQNSNVAATTVTKTAFGFAMTDNTDVPFGLATQQFKSIGYTDASQKLKASKPEDVAAFPDLDDLLIRLI